MNRIHCGRFRNSGRSVTGVNFDALYLGATRLIDWFWRANCAMFGDTAFGRALPLGRFVFLSHRPGAGAVEQINMNALPVLDPNAASAGGSWEEAPEKLSAS
jgi:hypothetical protein